MIRIAYRSKATQPELALVSLADIIAVSDRVNRRDGLSGGLLLSRGRFFQVLEGDEVDMDRALLRICRDPRHHGVEIVFRAQVTRQLFRDWAMVAVQVTPDVGPLIDTAIDMCNDAPVAAVERLRALVERQRR
ncbi:BLUF domain-containing protein [uncultured Brevundimonas sp.]|uniref:BLUF domain-containing protein n=1 Tax=uncultured Brevundimonas sp. TaxID=213418 RepID=UPI0025D49C75|nr:BLUF domain-containing protein [uncultured Brevundimonas sp.]